MLVHKVRRGNFLQGKVLFADPYPVTTRAKFKFRQMWRDDEPQPRQRQLKEIGLTNNGTTTHRAHKSRPALKIVGAILLFSGLVAGGCTDKKKLAKPLIPPLSGNALPSPGPAHEPSSAAQGVALAGRMQDFATFSPASRQTAYAAEFVQKDQ